jgi:hypothetical protein
MSKFLKTHALKAALAAAVAAAALAVSMAATAQDLSVGEIIVIGAIKEPATATPATTSDDAAIPALPVVYEPTAAPAGAADAAPAREAAASRTSPDLSDPVEAH